MEQKWAHSHLLAEGESRQKRIHVAEQLTHRKLTVFGTRTPHRGTAILFVNVSYKYNESKLALVRCCLKMKAIEKGKLEDLRAPRQLLCKKTLRPLGLYIHLIVKVL